MGQYKVPQDVEAEDKIIGPLTLKQFIFAILGVAWGAITFALFRRVPLFFVVFGIPPSLLFLLLGVYKRQDQPFDQLFLALVSFLTRPRKRLWEKEPIAEVFRVEPAPVKAEPITRNPEEVRGQLEKLVHVIESRGGVKQPELQEPSLEHQIQPSDRIFMPESLQPGAPPQEALDVSMSDDVLDFENNPNAQNLNHLIEGAVQKVRDQAISTMQTARGVTPPKQTPPPSGQAGVSGMTAPVPDDILKQTLAASELRVSQIAERANPPTLIKEGESVSLPRLNQDGGQQ